MSTLDLAMKGFLLCLTIVIIVRLICFDTSFDAVLGMAVIGAGIADFVVEGREFVLTRFGGVPREQIPPLPLLSMWGLLSRVLRGASISLAVFWLFST